MSIIHARFPQNLNIEDKSLPLDARKVIILSEFYILEN